MRVSISGNNMMMDMMCMCGMCMMMRTQNADSPCFISVKQR